MTETKRTVLLLGSLPFENEEDAMRRSLTYLGKDLLYLPDGEIGEKSDQYPNGNRAAWVQTIIDFCEQDLYNWEVVKPAIRGESGFPTGYDKEPRLKAKHPPSRMHEYLDFHWLSYFKTNYPLFKRLREEFNQPDLKFLVGLPTGLGGSFPMMSPMDALRYSSAFNKRMAYEANQMIKIADPDDLVFQIEVPAEFAFAHQLPDALIGFALRTAINLVKSIEPKAKFGVHICFGDLNNEALLKPETLDKMVLFSNQLVKRWPVTHSLDFIHYPLAEAADPPPMDRAYYEPLKGIELPRGVRFVAGFVHDKRSADEHGQILNIIEDIRGGSVDIACSCGLGRRSANVAEELIKESHRLALS